MTTDIRYFKLASGEEIVAEVIGSYPADSTYLLKNALAIHLVPTETGQVGVQTIHFPMICTEGKSFTLYLSSVAVESSEVSQEFLNQYNQKYGSGIQIVPSLHSGQMLNG